jgi:hypothetical protein
MSKYGVCLAEKPLLQHLCRGGSVRDDAGAVMVREFIEKITNDPAISAIIARHNLTSEDLAALYAAAIDHMMPTPWMNAAGPMLAVTAFFVEPHRLDAVLQEAHRQIDGLGIPSELRLKWKARVMWQEASLLKSSHDHAFGPANVERYTTGGKSGCLGVLMLPVLLVLALLFLC